ncbi:Gamma-aminobutyric acid type B receptor subunit 1 [Holothuria leucospilota]|uniref:Gamma-aminobutyric acid type B receptor subunit 1 n=1 Tax=Holothuria leucospilota TaxID=206669 RepID=A0A9Q1CGW1_HOLLE|nr:Gamma-aminobutyric acid type B receptor subunit 1 [Holothuria leucospilota]
MVSMTGKWDGSGCLLAAELALEQINNRSDILSDYELKVIWNDTQCTSSLPPRALYHHIVNEPKKLLLLGPSCSSGATLVASAAQYWNLLTVIPTAVSPALADRSLYPKLYRTVQTGVSTYNGPALWFMRNFGWRRVASVADSAEDAIVDQNDFVGRAFALNASVVSETVSLTAKNQMENIKNLDMKIIFSFPFEEKARLIFCEAYRVGLYGQDMFWMIPGWFRENWWLFKNDDVDCTLEEMAEIVEISLPVTVDVERISPLNKTTVSGITPAEFVEVLRERLTWPQYKTYTLNNYIAYQYDAVWAIALMLNRSAAVLSRRNSGSRLEDFNYSSSDLSQIFFDEMAVTDFFGASGHVSFTQGERVGGAVLTQLQGHCDKGWHLHLRYCYKLKYNETADWTRAVTSCEKDGSYMADIMTLDEISFINELRKSSATNISTDVNVGLHFVEQKFGNMTNRTLLDLRNRTSEWKIPDVYGNNVSHGCIFIDFQNKGSLQAGDCLEEKPFVCKKKANFMFVPIGNYYTLTDTMVWTGRIQWPGGRVPDDGSGSSQITIERIERPLAGYLHIILFSIAVFGMTLVVLTLILTIRFANTRAFCDSSPVLNYVILTSCFMLYFSLILTKSQLLISLSDRNHALICQIRKTITSVAITLGISTLVGKMWLIHGKSKIFSAPYKEVTTVRRVYFIIAVSVVTDVTCMTFSNIYYPTDLRTISLEKQVDPAQTYHITEYYTKLCSSDSDILPVLLILTDKVVLLLVGALLSYGVRQANITSLADSRQVSIAIYNAIIFCACGLILTHLLKSAPVTLLVFTSALVVFCTSVTLLILFLPKVISVIKSQPETCSTHKTNDGVLYITEIMSDSIGSSSEALSLRYRGKVPKELLEENIRLKKQLSELLEKAETNKSTVPTSL